MARWRLLQPHYLNLDKAQHEDINQWQYTEQDQGSKKNLRKTFYVPVLLDPKDTAYHNYPGEIIVATDTKGGRNDYIFVGEPTPDMEPLDDDAEAITEGVRHKWKHPIDSLSAEGGYAGGLEQQFMSQFTKLMEAARSANGGAPVTTAPATSEELAEAQKQIQELQAQVKQLMELAGQNVAAAAAEPKTAEKARRA